MEFFYKELDHASKVPYQDFVRNYSQVSFASFSKKVWLWIVWTIKIFAKTLFFLIRREDALNSTNYENFEWVLMNDHKGHSVNLMDGIIDKFTTLSSVLFLSCNKNLLSPSSDIIFKQNLFRSISLKSFLSSINYSIDRLNRFSGLGFWALPAFLNHVFDCSRIIEACKFYQQVRFSKEAKLICLCDSHWHQSVVTSVFNERGLSTFTCMHGVPSKWDIISPFNSQYVLSWGELMSKAIVQNCEDMTQERVVLIGNSKYKNSSLSVIQKPNNFKEMNEIIFISPCYNCSDTYGLKGLGEEIIKFLDLNVPGLQFGIRPYPYAEEIEFIKNLIKDRSLEKKVKIYTDANFDDLVVPNRLFVGSISSAISDVIIKGGFFVGLCDLLSENLVSTNICYSSDIYFNMEDLQLFMYELNEDIVFHEHLDKLSNLRQGLIGPEIKLIEPYLRKVIENRDP